MRLQLTSWVLGALVALPALAAADGSVTVRGVYYKERATRVMQPMLDSVFEVGSRGLVTAHFLADAITSASTSAGAENAEPFTEIRYEAGGGYTHELRDLRLAANGRYSTESDYRSLFVGLRGELDLAQKNTTLGLGGGISLDKVSGQGDGGLAQQMILCEPGREQTECDLTTYSLFASASQLLSSQAVFGLSIDIAKLSGYQSNPYRTAIAGDELVPERHPTSRLRQAYAGSLRYFVRRTETTLIAAYRYYRDNWEVHGHTPELRVIQQIGDSVDAAVRYRYHTQDGAFFYRERYPTPDVMFVSDDVKLSSTRTQLLEAKLGIAGEAFGLEGRWASARFEGILQYFAQYNRFGNAIIAHIGVTVPLEY
jgi:hypothetical protein